MLGVDLTLSGSRDLTNPRPAPPPGAPTQQQRQQQGAVLTPAKGVPYSPTVKEPPAVKGRYTVQVVPKYECPPPTTIREFDTKRSQDWCAGIYAATINLLKELDKTHEACNLANTQHGSLEEIIAAYASAVKEATKEQDVIGLSEVLAGYTPAEITSMIQEAGDNLGEFMPICQPLDLPYSKTLNKKRLVVLHGDLMFSFARNNDQGADGMTDRNSKIISKLLTDTFGPEGLNYADECRAVITIGGVLNDTSKFCMDLVIEIEDGLTPPGILLTQPDFKVDQEKLQAECRKVFFSSCAAYNDLVHQSGKLVPHHGILNATAHGLYYHMKYFTTARISIGNAED